MNPVIRFEADGYDPRRPWLMGRQVAGHGFLRAAVTERAPGPLYCYAPTRPTAEAFARLAKEIAPDVDCRWIGGAQLERIGPAGGVLYLADPTLPAFAKARLREGVGAYALCGVTHTTASPGVMQALADLLTAPVAPWDALVCTSRAVETTVRQVLEAEAENLRWRLGPGVRIAPPALPVIPLGVHCDDYAISEGEREAARAALLEPGEVAALFVGRLAFSAKQHPLALYRGLQMAAERTGKRVALILCGWTPNDEIAKAYSESPAKFCPDVRIIRVEGRDPDAKRQAWAAADLFASLSDNIQETFGLTPVEAMAAGLPCVVTDWNGYRDTVRDGIDGFRVRTWAPSPGVAGEQIARELQTGEGDYDRFIWAAALASSVDLGELTERLCRLIESPELRRQMGEAGQRRAREVFDWPHVYRQYRALWADQEARRVAALRSPEGAAWVAQAPRNAPAWPDPFAAHAHYPTALIGPYTVLRLTAEASLSALGLRRADILFTGARLPPQVAADALHHLASGPLSVARLAGALGIPEGAAIYASGLLAKMGLVELAGGAERPQDGG